MEVANSDGDLAKIEASAPKKRKLSVATKPHVRKYFHHFKTILWNHAVIMQRGEKKTIKILPRMYSLFGSDKKNNAFKMLIGRFEELAVVGLDELKKMTELQKSIGSFLSEPLTDLKRNCPSDCKTCETGETSMTLSAKWAKDDEQNFLFYILDETRAKAIYEELGWPLPKGI